MRRIGKLVSNTNHWTPAGSWAGIGTEASINLAAEEQL